MVYIRHKRNCTNKFSKIKRAIREFLKIDRKTFVIIAFVEIGFTFVNFLALFALNNLLQVLGKKNSISYFALVVEALLIYLFVVLILQVKKSFFNSYYVQFVLLPSFEKKFKLHMQDISSNIEPIKFEDRKIYRDIYEASVSATNIFRLVEISIEKIGLILNFILLSVFFINLSWTYLLFLLLSLILGYIENNSKHRIIDESKDEIHKFTLKKLEITDLLTRPGYVRDNEIYNFYTFIKCKCDKLFDNFEKTAQKVNNDLAFKAGKIKILSLILNIALYFYLYYILMVRKDFVGFALSFFAMRMILQTSEQYSSLSSYEGIFIDMTEAYFKFYKTYKDAKKKALSEDFNNFLEFKNIKFKYPNSTNYTLDKLDLKIEKGKTYVIVGENGSGKTSLVSIILGLYKAESGSVLVDGSRVDVDLLDTYTDKSATFQNYAKYPLSIIENVTISDTKASKDRAINILDKSSFRTFPYEKIVGEDLGDFNLSKGQWQELAILRCIYRNRNFVIFDEPTNDIDPLKEEKIFKFLEKYKENRTMIIISHKLLSAKLADEIIVMADGEISQRGSFDKLRGEEGAFKRIWDAKSESFR
ncbi:ABC transporter ATP-binding protein [Anaerococcus sp. AGMB09787]|uniref:ATP-binding cassette domain-containing protein n=1 Tax=Anaerococcus sp. AGMB09787 TaxID=2922869 RepID=UPI001FAF79BD|nr:ABC transporter ATP-binding protein [Anaerococcus sp. AGMB09787]